ncbi:15179_t:CDS:2, partial [Gigaspora margarita]
SGHNWNLKNKHQQREARGIFKNMSPYKGFWSGSAEKKNKGSGMGFLIRSTIEKHVGKIEHINEYLLVVYLYFKKCSLMIINTYIPQTEKDAVKIIINTIQDRIKKHSNAFHIIVLGDLNHILKERDFKDIYRELNSEKKEYTWNNSHTFTRIDQILLDSKLRRMCIVASIEKMDSITGSNHDLALVVLRKQKDPNSATSTFGQFSKADKKSNRTKWCLDQASKENWKDYQNLL